MKATQLTKAVEQRCRACRWFDPDTWADCYNGDCPNQYVKELALEGGAVNQITSAITLVCLKCASNLKDTCHYDCSYHLLGIGPTWEIVHYGKFRRLRGSCGA